jgi:hypothetical protein
MMKIILLEAIFLLQAASIFCQTNIRGFIQTNKDQPVPGANVYFKGTIEGTSSDENGKFLLSTDLTGNKILVVSCIGYKTYEEPLELQNNEINLIVRISQNDIELKEVTVYAGTFEAGDKKKSVVLNRLDMATNPIGFGDALSVIRTLPGTSNAGDEGGLIVRGGEQNETKTFIDGLLVESPYTAKMPNVPVRGRFSPMLFRGTVFSTGGYSAEYGQALSAILLLTSIDMPEKDETGISVFFSGASFNKSNKWEKSSLSASLQYVNMSPVYGIMNSNIKWDHAPENFSPMIAYRHKAGERGLLKVLTNFSMDRSSMNYPNLDTRSDDIISLKNSDMFIVSSYRGIAGKDWIVNSGISYNYDNEKIKLNSDDIVTLKQSYEVKLSLTKPVDEKIKIKFGASLFHDDYSRSYLPYKGDLLKWKFRNPLFATFAETEIKLSKRISARIGGRAEVLSLSDEVCLSPRISLAYKTSANSQVSMGYGEFSEQPENEYLVYNNNLKSGHASHYIINYQLTKNSRIFRIEAYYKNYSRLVKYDSLYAVAHEAYNNNGWGYARGIDLFYRDSKSIKNGDFWISYSFIDSKRNYRDYSFAHAPFFISRHNLSVVYKYYISKTDSYISAGYEYASGRPYINPNTDMTSLESTKSYNNLSISVFHFTKVFGKFTMIFAQVSNLLGSENIFGYRYSKYPDESGVYESAPVLPVSRRFFLIGLFVSFTGKPEI